MLTIDVWRVSLDQSVEQVAELHELLDERERDRASKFHKVEDRRRFIAARGTLRLLLGRYTSSAPEDVSICIRPGGKPSLDRQRHSKGVHFNVSHCGDLALLAFADSEVGIDLQRVEEITDISAIVANFFSEKETAAFNQLHAAERHQFFYRAWARKEAYVKATGAGFAVDPAKVCVGTAVEDATIDNYRILDIVGVNDHAASIAVAAGSHPPVIRFREWQSPDRESETSTDGVGFEPTVRY